MSDIAYQIEGFPVIAKPADVIITKYENVGYNDTFKYT